MKMPEVIVALACWGMGMKIELASRRRVQNIARRIMLIFDKWLIVENREQDIRVRFRQRPRYIDDIHCRTGDVLEFCAVRCCHVCLL